MKAILVRNPGGVENLFLGDTSDPVPHEHEVLVKVAATALNRADILQRKGKYPPPAGASPLLGLEISGEVVALGNKVSKWKVGDRVFGLLPGGGYAQYATIHEDMALPLPNFLSFEEAAAIPEVFITAFQALCWHGNLKNKESVLIHAGASGVGTAAIQIARQFDATILVTASAEKHEICSQLGAQLAIDYKSQDFKEEVAKFTEGKGVNIIIDFIAGPYFEKNIDSLSIDGRLVILATMGGGKIENINMQTWLMKRLSILNSTLRSRSLDYKIKLNQDFASFALPLFEKKLMKPVIDAVYDWQEVQQAQQHMEENKNSGKIVLKVI